MIRRSSIARNSFWYGLESILDSVVSLIVSVIVARVIGPQRLGYFIYVMFLINLAGRLGGCGPGAATRKYLAEYLGRGERGLARHVFFTMLRWHVGLGFAFAIFGWVCTFAFGDPQQWLVASMLVASMIATVVNTVPSQANMAAENFARNVPASLTSLLVYVILVGLALWQGWGLAGLAAAFLARRTLEMVMRLVPALSWARELPRQAVSAQMGAKLMSFSGKSLAVALLLIVVWDRSELVLLKRFSAIQEVTFYSVAFSITEALLLLPNVIGAAVSARLMAEHGRSAGNVGPLAAASIRYLALLVFPVYVGLASLSSPVIQVAYGQSYLPAIPVLLVALLLAIPKAFYWLPTALLQALDRQGAMFRCLFIVAILNIALDLALIPGYGALGATIGNGLAQSAAVIALIVVTARIGRIAMPWMALLKNLLVTLAMGGIVWVAVLQLPPIAAVVVGPVLGAVLYVVLVRVAGLVSPADVASIEALSERIPLRIRRPALQLLVWVANGKSTTVATDSVDLAASRVDAAGS